MIKVYIDNNVWDFLFEHRIDLATELPNSDFLLYITREAEFEIPPITSDELKEFILGTIKNCGIQTDVIFGFDDGSLPKNEQRIGGFGVGRWIKPDEMDFVNQQINQQPQGEKRKTKLYKNEADLSLAARSFDSVVLTFEKSTKSGPLKRAEQQGGNIVRLTDFEKSNLSLGTFIKSSLKDAQAADSCIE